MTSQQSPAWKNPRDVMRTHLKRRSSRRLLIDKHSSSIAPNSADLCTESQPPLTSASLTGRGSGKSNPFKLSPRKRPRAAKVEKGKENCDPDLEDSNANAPFSLRVKVSRLESLEEDKQQSVSSAHFELADVYAVDFSDLHLVHSTPKESVVVGVQERTKRTSAPIDLRPGTMLRIARKKPFPWMPTGAAGTTPGSVLVQTKGAESSLGDAPFMARLHAATLYWQYPDIPWMTTFPRLDDRPKLASSRDSPVPSIATLGEQLATSLNQQWQESFEQLFCSWKSGDRDSFYVCCPNLTIVFLKTERNGETIPKAVVTPTTLGLRQALRDEEIEYEMPLRSSSSRRSSRETAGSDSNTFCTTLAADVTHSQPPILNTNGLSSAAVSAVAETLNCIEPPATSGCDSDTSPNKLNSSNESDHAAWLHDIGISPLTTLKLRRYSSVSDRSTGSSGSTEDAAKSAVVVTDSASLQGLFNLVFSSKLCRAVTGPQAGLPPTLIADRPFQNSALKALKKSSQISRRSSKEQQFVFELDGGPIMPSHVRRLIDVFAVSNNDESTVTVVGRSAYPGLNAVVDAERFADITEFAVEGGKFCW
uniref:Uncharacterized protein n=1 Tax=Plectus sambesii TaxID=2011161 RepID=A0A914X1F8_9BILA